jgi:ornithine cyclodeaminase/alanine dehydrogenase-like protein (mu-crystallin family)
VRVHSPRKERRKAFAAAFDAELGVPVSAVADPAAATDGADMALCATATGGRVALRAADAAGLAYVSSIGSTLPSQIELDPAAILGAAQVVIDTPDALEESGDLIAAREAGLDESRVVLLARYLADPADLSPAASGVRGAERRSAVATAPGDASARGGTIYKSIGSIEQDLALGVAVWRAAEERDRGEVIAEIELCKEPPQ